uniref:Uncharacterized protein n=1 Tax=Talaromyces marneffei PM1 TaxID=1077442 RepID=A0A093UVU7_TALMA
MQFKYLFAVVFATLAAASPIVPDGCTVAEDGPVARSPSWLNARSPRPQGPSCPVVGISNPNIPLI